MTRDQAKAIIANIELIRHFADGGDIGHRTYTCTGEFLGINPAHKINLCNLRVDERYYIRLKAKLVWNSECNGYVRRERHWPEKVPTNEAICRPRITL